MTDLIIVGIETVAIFAPFLWCMRTEAEMGKRDPMKGIERIVEVRG